MVPVRHCVSFRILLTAGLFALVSYSFGADIVAPEKAPPESTKTVPLEDDAPVPVNARPVEVLPLAEFADLKSPVTAKPKENVAPKTTRNDVIGAVPPAGTFGEIVDEHPKKASAVPPVFPPDVVSGITLALARAGQSIVKTVTAPAGAPVENKVTVETPMAEIMGDTDGAETVEVKSNMSAKEKLVKSSRADDDSAEELEDKYAAVKPQAAGVNANSALTGAAAVGSAQPETPKTDAPAPPSAPKPPASGPGGQSMRGQLDDDELEQVYAPSSVEGYAGWKRNKVPSRQLIDQDSVGVPDRWRIGLYGDSRHVKGNFWNPYRQNMLKGDYPIIGQSIFLSTTFASDTQIEGHSNPTPSGVSAQNPGSFGFFGRPDQFLLQQNFIISLELFKGETDFKPREWEVRMTPVFNLNYTDVQENFAVNIDPRFGKTRLDSHESFQEFFGEYHFRDLSPNYDFISSRTGIQSFNEDFRGFLFADNNLGARVFGNLESNRLQYNLAYFDMLDKDTNSGLNTFSFKQQHVVLANVIRQDTLWKGFNIIGNMAYDEEEANRHYNENGVIVRPAPIGDLFTHSNKVVYAGFGTEGHVGHFNVTSQYYEALGEDSHNPLAGRSQHINAQMAASEYSYDMDWMRFRASLFYASGDHNTTDGKATGFDAIFDDPNFAGGHNSWWVSQGGFGAGNALTALKNRSSLLPSLNTSKGEGQRNFVNPGLHLYNVGYDADLSQNLKAVLNVNYLQFDDTSSLQELLHQNSIQKSIGIDSSLGMVYRPFLNNQVVITGAASTLSPSQGFKDIYNHKQLYAGSLSVTVRY